MSPLLYDIKANLERNALKHCIDHITPWLSDPQCKPFLVLGVNFGVESTGLNSTVTYNFVPFLCDDECEAHELIQMSGCEWGTVLKVSEVRRKFSIQIKK